MSLSNLIPMKYLLIFIVSFGSIELCSQIELKDSLQRLDTNNFDQPQMYSYHLQLGLAENNMNKGRGLEHFKRAYSHANTTNQRQESTYWVGKILAIHSRSEESYNWLMRSLTYFDNNHSDQVAKHNVYEAIALNFGIVGYDDSALFYNNKAKEISISLNDSNMINWDDYRIAGNYMYMNKPVKAINLYMDLYTKYENDRKKKYQVSFSLGNLFTTVQDYRRALFYFYDALKDTTWEGYNVNNYSAIYSVISVAYDNLNIMDSAIYYRQLSLKYSLKDSSSFANIFLFDNYLKYGQLLSDMGQYDSALVMCNNANGLIQKAMNPLGYAELQNTLIYIFTNSNKLVNA